MTREEAAERAEVERAKCRRNLMVQARQFIRSEGRREQVASMTAVTFLPPRCEDCGAKPGKPHQSWCAR